MRTTRVIVASAPLTVSGLLSSFGAWLGIFPTEAFVLGWALTIAGSIVFSVMGLIELRRWDRRERELRERDEREGRTRR